MSGRRRWLGLLVLLTACGSVTAPATVPSATPLVVPSRVGASTTVTRPVATPAAIATVDRTATRTTTPAPLAEPGVIAVAPPLGPAADNTMVPVDVPVTFVPHLGGATAAHFALYRNTRRTLSASQDELRLLGELTNRGPAPVDRLALRVALLDAAGAELVAYEGLIHVAPTTLAPGETTVWQLGTSAPGGVPAVRIAVVDDTRDGARATTSRGLAVRDVTVAPLEYGRLRVRSQIANLGDTPTAASPGVKVGLYDAGGRLVGVAECTPGRAPLPQGQAAPCDIAGMAPYSPVATVRVVPYVWR